MSHALAAAYAAEVAAQCVYNWHQAQVTAQVEASQAHTRSQYSNARLGKSKELATKVLKQRQIAI
eukprot:12789-Heterococcus_DN1.PRE.1